VAQSSVGDNILFLGGFALAAALQRQGLDRELALAGQLDGGRPVDRASGTVTFDRMQRSIDPTP
jgi:hypothetical protein